VAILILDLSGIALREGRSDLPSIHREMFNPVLLERVWSSSVILKVLPGWLSPRSSSGPLLWLRFGDQTPPKPTIDHRCGQVVRRSQTPTVASAGYWPTGTRPA